MHFFGRKNRLPNSLELQRTKWFSEAIGRTLTCYDGHVTRCVEIVHSYNFPWFAVINEKDPDSKAGHFITHFSLMNQILNNYVPTKDEDEHFIKSVRARWEIPEKGIQEGHPFDKADHGLVDAGGRPLGNTQLD